MSSPSSPLSPYSTASSPASHPTHLAPPSPTYDFDSDDASMSDVSSDTSGSVPASPGVDPHDDDTLEQVSICRWEGCGIDLGNMDSLVKHIHDIHIGTRKATYSCQWDDCNRKGLPHASGYALRAHMRSHTKEKPFYCSLPGT